METFKFIKGKYTNEKVVADSGVIKAVLSNGTEVTNSVNNEDFQTAALVRGNVSDKEIKVYTLRESLSNINPIGEVTDDNTVTISSLGVTESPSGVTLPQAAAAALSETLATAELPNEITWNNSSGDVTTKVNVTVGKATVGKSAKFTISGTVTVKKFIKASGIVIGKLVYTKSTLTTSGTTSNNYYKDGRKCVAIGAYKTEEKVIKNPSDLTGGQYHNLVVNSEANWKLGIDRDGDIGSAISDGTGLQDSFNINNASFNETAKKYIQVSAWLKTADKSYTKKSEVTVVCDPTVYYQGHRLPTGSCFNINGNELNTISDLTNINTVYKEKCDVILGDVPYKYDSEDTDTYYTYASEERVQSSRENCNIINNMLVANQTSFTKEGDENSIYLNARVDGVKKMVVFQ